MNAPTTALAALQTDAELIDVLCSSLYPGAKRESAAMVLSYCRAAGLDPLQKPVHIVPMKVKTGEKNRFGDDVYAMRDTVMPGIGLYRVQAARTGAYAGQDAPELGPMCELTYQHRHREWVTVPGQDKKQPKDTWVEKTVLYPEWASVTVYRIVGGLRVPFVAREYWLENYATAGTESDAPNAMWARRTIGQLVKCAEAQALRKGFPEVGSQPTAEEMEGMYPTDWTEAPQPEAATPPRPRRASEAAPLDTSVDLDRPFEDATVKAPAEAPAPAPMQEPAPAATRAAAPAAAPATGEPATVGECMNVIKTAQAKRVNLGALLAECGMTHLNAETLSGMTKAEFKVLKGAM